jgi:hypothetical protein
MHDHIYLERERERERGELHNPLEFASLSLSLSGILEFTSLSLSLSPKRSNHCIQAGSAQE